MPKLKEWNTPVNRWKLLILVLFGCLIIFGGGYGILAFTNSPSFCKSCHEMAPEYATYTDSSHKQISCVQCHINPGFTNMITHKIKSVKEVYYHVTGVPNQIVQTEEELITNQNCLQCHSKNRLVTASKDLKVNHNGHMEKGIPCITCHSGVVHAKIASRGLNISEYLGYWTKENTKKVMQEKYLKTNMGTCIDCHDKVNNGEKPWKEISYSLPPHPEKSKETEEEAQSHRTQQIILQAIGKQIIKVKISMKCETCHKKVRVPASHQIVDWDQNHGSTAFYQLEKCLNCHQDSKWIKDIPKDDIVSLFIMDRPETIDNTFAGLVNQTRNNPFCGTCHNFEPPSHAKGGAWIKGHAYASIHNEDKWKCYVCHDKEKSNITSNLTIIKEKEVIACFDCHKHGFSGILNNKAGY